MRSHQLMWEPVYPQGRQPVLVRANVPYRLRRLLVHRLDTESRHYDVLFLGTGGSSPQLCGRCHHGAAWVAPWSRQPGGLPTLTAPPPAAFTDDGKVLKVALAGGVSRGPEVISLEEISVTKVQAAMKCYKHRGKPVGLEPSHLPAPHPVPEGARGWPIGARTEMGGLSPRLKAELLGRAILGCPRQAEPAQAPCMEQMEL